MEVSYYARVIKGKLDGILSAVTSWNAVFWKTYTDITDMLQKSQPCKGSFISLTDLLFSATTEQLKGQELLSFNLPVS